MFTQGIPGLAHTTQNIIYVTISEWSCRKKRPNDGVVASKKRQIYFLMIGCSEWVPLWNAPKKSLRHYALAWATIAIRLRPPSNQGIATNSSCTRYLVVASVSPKRNLVMMVCICFISVGLLASRVISYHSVEDMRWFATTMQRGNDS